jgi:hypothetical protein
MDVSRRRGHCVDNLGPAINANMGFHSEIPLIPFLGVNGGEEAPLFGD